MSMDGLTAIGQRVAEIASLVADPALALSGTATGATSASSGSAFAAMLAEALAADGTTGTATLDDSSGSGSAASLLDGSGLSAASLLSALGASGTTGVSGAAGSGLSSSSLLAELGLSGASGASASGLSSAAVLQALGLAGVTGVASLGGTGSTSTGGATGAGALDADGVPADLAAYGNGRIPASALAPVGSTGARMWQPAAQALNGVIAAAKADGVTIGVTEGYRSYGEQVSLAKTKGLYSDGGLAAVPGTSEHGWGMAADLKLDSSALAWMRTNGARFGFVESTPRESWHWSYRPNG